MFLEMAAEKRGREVAYVHMFLDYASCEATTCGFIDFRVHGLYSPRAMFLKMADTCLSHATSKKGLRIAVRRKPTMSQPCDVASKMSNSILDQSKQ